MIITQMEIQTLGHKQTTTPLEHGREGEKSWQRWEDQRGHSYRRAASLLISRRPAGKSTARHLTQIQVWRHWYKFSGIPTF